MTVLSKARREELRLQVDRDDANMTDTFNLTFNELRALLAQDEKVEQALAKADGCHCGHGGSCDCAGNALDILRGGAQ